MHLRLAFLIFEDRLIGALRSQPAPTLEKRSEYSKTRHLRRTIQANGLTRRAGGVQIINAFSADARNREMLRAKRAHEGVVGTWLRTYLPTREEDPRIKLPREEGGQPEKYIGTCTGPLASPPNLSPTLNRGEIEGLSYRIILRARAQCERTF